MRPDAAIAGCVDAHRRLLADIGDVDDEITRRPSLLPDWTVGHLLTHVARNADSVTRRLDGARRGEVVDQYPGGAEGRAADIEAGAARPAADILADVRDSAAALESAFDALPDDAWDRPGRDVYGNETPVRELAMVRWREVAIHHVDLGLGYTSADWPPALVDHLLAFVLPTLPDRAERHSLVAWAIGRGPAPDLGPWR